MGDNKADRNLYSPLNLPREWTGTMRNFGVQLVRIIEDLYNRLSKCIPYTKPASEKKALSAAQKSQARENIGLGSAATRGVANHLTTASSSYVLDARQGTVLYDRFANAIAIISTGNTHAAITSGQYVYVKSHSTLDVGLYKATGNIAQNAALTASNLTEVSNGIGGEVYTIYDQITMYNIGNSYATLAAFESALTAFGSSMENSSSRPIRFTVGTAFGVFPTGVYQGIFSRHTDGRYAVEAKRFSGSAPIYTGNYNTSWSWMGVSDNSYEFTCLKNGGKLRFSCSNTTGSMWMITAFRGAVGNDLGSWIAIMGSTSAIAKNLCTIGSNLALAFDSGTNKLTLTNSDSTNDVYVSVVRLYGTGTLTGTQA